MAFLTRFGAFLGPVSVCGTERSSAPLFLLLKASLIRRRLAVKTEYDGLVAVV